MGVERIRPGVLLPGDGEPPDDMETRIARLEEAVSNTNATAQEFRGEMRQFISDTHQDFREVRATVNRLMYAVVGFGLAALGVMAKGFGWL